MPWHRVKAALRAEKKKVPWGVGSTQVARGTSPADGAPVVRLLPADGGAAALAALWAEGQPQEEEEEEEEDELEDEEPAGRPLPESANEVAQLCIEVPTVTRMYSKDDDERREVRPARLLPNCAVDWPGLQQALGHAAANLCPDRGRAAEELDVAGIAQLDVAHKELASSLVYDRSTSSRVEFAASFSKMMVYTPGGVSGPVIEKKTWDPEDVLLLVDCSPGPCDGARLLFNIEAAGAADEGLAEDVTGEEGITVRLCWAPRRAGDWCCFRGMQRHEVSAVTSGYRALAVYELRAERRSSEVLPPDLERCETGDEETDVRYQATGCTKRPKEDHTASMSDFDVSNKVMTFCTLKDRTVSYPIPKVAALVSADKEDQVKLEANGLTVVALASITWHSQECKLFVVTLSHPVPDQSQHVHLTRLLGLASRCFEGTCDFMEDNIWPLHDPLVRLHLTQLRLEQYTKKGGFFQAIRHFCCFVRIATPSRRVLLLQDIRDFYGEAVSFSFTWPFFYCQQLWLCAASYAIWVTWDINPVGSTSGLGDRLRWEGGKTLVLFWAGLLAFVGWWRYAVHFIDQTGPTSVWRHSIRSNYKADEGRVHTCCRWMTFLIIALPVVFVFIMIVLSVLVAITQLMLHSIYIWGDCIRLPQPCRDPAVKHGFVGWLVEVSLDILLAILFEIFFALECLLAEWLIGLRNYEFKSDHDFNVKMLKAALSAIERLGFIGSLAFFFVPQWEIPSTRETVDLGRDCSDLFLGESSFFCLQRRLPLENRRWVFEKLMKGPFFVAPFVQIILKVIVPWVARKLDSFSTRYARVSPGMITRLLGLIFSYDGGTVGCFQYVLRKGPFHDVFMEDLSPDYNATPSSKEVFAKLTQGEDARLIRRALQEITRKPFSADDELMDLQMNFLWVVACMPMKPIGVLPTLAAQILSSHLKLRKLLFVQRRPWPEQGKVLRQSQAAFCFGVAFGGMGWSVGLSIMTYNDELWKWKWWGRLYATITILWLTASVWMMFAYNWLRTNKDSRESE